MTDPVFNTMKPDEDDYLDYLAEDNGTDVIANLKSNESTTMHPDAIQTVTTSFGITMAFVGMALFGFLVILAIIFGIIHCRRKKKNGPSRDAESAQQEPEDKLLNIHDSNHNQDSNGVDSPEPTRISTNKIPKSLHETSL